MPDGDVNPLLPRKGRVKGVPKGYQRTVAPRKLDDLYIPVPESGCWIWAGSTDLYGYGIHKGARAHRVFYQLHKGKLKPGHNPCHKCDTPSCVNPDHMFAGTQLDNARDMCRKGRQAKGEAWGRSEKSMARATEIERRLADGGEVRALALEFRVPVALVVRAKSRLLAKRRAQMGV